MSMNKEILIKSPLYEDAKSLKYTSPSQIITMLLNVLEDHFEANLINTDFFYPKQEKKLFGYVSDFIENELIENAIKESKETQFLDMKKVNTRNKSNNTTKTPEKVFETKIKNSLKTEFKKSISTWHPFISANFRFFIVSNCKIDNVLETVNDISNIMASKIKNFKIFIDLEEQGIITNNQYPNENNNGNDMENKKYYNKIIFGPTGTGKSHFCSNEAKHIISENVFRTTFYEDYTYYDFFGQYKPVVLRNTGSYIQAPTYSDRNKTVQLAEHRITYQFVPGIFFKALLKSLILEQSNDDKEVLLIIEEINRGNCSSIFGDIFQLLDRNPDGSSSYSLSLSDDLRRYLVDIRYDISNISKQDTEYNPFNLKITSDIILKVLESILQKDKLYIPKNLKIIGTMNTSDQSLFPMDSAFKRRWDMQYSPIDYEEEILKNVIIGKTNLKWCSTLADINKVIYEKTKTEDKQIGQWFIKHENNFVSEYEFKNKLISYLYFDVFKHFPEVFNHLPYSSLSTLPVIDIIELLKKQIKDNSMPSNRKK